METYTLSEPEKIPTPPASEEQPQLPKKSNKKLLIGVGIGVGFVVMFLLGMTISSLTRPKPQIVQEITPTPTVSPAKVTPNVTKMPSESNNVIRYLPGKEYLDDSIAIITKSEPKKAILISLSRFEQDKNYTQYAKVNYYDGTTWARETITTTAPDSNIVTNPLVSSWTIRPRAFTTSGRDSMTIQIKIENKPVTFSVTKLTDDISTRALPGFTKFTYFGTGSLTTGDEKADAYIAYTQSYARNSSDVTYLNAPERLTSNWLVFWDTDGNAYQLDSISSNQRSVIYENAISAISMQSSGAYVKPSTFTLSKSTQNGQYTANISSSTPTLIQFALVAPLEKSDSKAYKWVTALTTGNVVIDRKTTPGVGIFETIER